MVVVEVVVEVEAEAEVEVEVEAEVEVEVEVEGCGSPIPLATSDGEGRVRFWARSEIKLASFVKLFTASLNSTSVLPSGVKWTTLSRVNKSPLRVNLLSVLSPLETMRTFPIPSIASSLPCGPIFILSLKS